jgi:hypothetical protein
MEILKTTDYTLFQPILGNRELNPVKIKKICADIENGFNMLPYSPIIVSNQKGKLGIIDGQHRMEVSKRTKNPIYYVICDDITLKQIAQLNSRQEKWKATDFLSCYIKLGIEDYKDILSITNEFKLSIKTATDLLMDFSYHSRTTEDFQNGDFKSNHFEETKKLLRLTEKLFSKYVFSKDRYLIGALIKLQEKNLCDFEKLYSKIEAAPNIMERHHSIKGYIYNIERVYNHKNSIREVIY